MRRYPYSEPLAPYFPLSSAASQAAACHPLPNSRDSIMSVLATISRAGAAFALTAAAAAPSFADTLDTVRERGVVHCGTTTGFAGFSAPDDQGNWKGLD